MLINYLEHFLYENYIFKQKLRIKWNLDFCIVKEFIVFKSIVKTTKFFTSDVIVELEFTYV